MASWLFLLVSLIGAGFTATACFRGWRFGPTLVPYFFAGWLTSELALLHMAWQAIATVVFIAFGALAAWPGWLGLAITLVSWAGLLSLQRGARLSGPAFSRALHEGLGEDFGMVAPPFPLGRIARPFRMRHAEVERIRNLAYGEAGFRNLLDVYRPKTPAQGCPVLLQIHGGAWTVGRKDQQGLPLMNHLASRGWVCVAPNYRLSPRATFPDHLVDVKRALAWVREHIREYGGDPDFVVVTGGSAGGHLASLVALTANDPRYQPGFEDVDTSVAACVPFYGVYDFLDRHGARGRASMRVFLERIVMKCSPSSERERWDEASPIARVHADAPPFFVIHGSHDSLAFVEEARHFVQALSSVSRKPVLYAEIPGAQHAFEIFHSERCLQAVQSVTTFVEAIRARASHGEIRQTG